MQKLAGFFSLVALSLFIDPQALSSPSTQVQLVDCGVGDGLAMGEPRLQTLAGSKCAGTDCRRPASYLGFDGVELHGQVTVGEHSAWFVPDGEVVDDEVLARLIRATDALYRDYRDRLGVVPESPLGDRAGRPEPLPIAFVPCSYPMCRDEAGNRIASARGVLGAPGIEVYFDAEEGFTLAERLGEWASEATGTGQLTRTLAHELGHNFDVSWRSGIRGSGDSHAWTSLLAADRVMRHADRSGSLPFVEYDIGVLAARPRTLGTTLTERFLAPHVNEPSPLLFECGRWGNSCDQVPVHPRSLYTALAVRLQQLTGRDVVGDLLRSRLEGRFPGDTFYWSVDHVVRVAAEAAGVDESCLASLMHTETTAASSAGPAHSGPCADEDGDGVPTLIDLLPRTPPHVVSPAAGGKTILSLPAHVEGELASGQLDRLAIELEPDRVLRYRLCAHDGVVGAEHDLSGGLPETPSYVLDPAEPGTCTSLGRLVPYRGQRGGSIELVGQGRYSLELWSEEDGPSLHAPRAIAWLQPEAGGHRLLWRTLATGGDVPDTEAWLVESGGFRHLLPGAASGSLWLPGRPAPGLSVRSAPGEFEPAGERLLPLLASRQPPGLELASAAGSWHDPERPGWGLQLVVDESNESPQLSVLVHTYESMYASEPGRSAQSWLSGTAALDAVREDGIEVRMRSAPVSATSGAASVASAVDWGSLLIRAEGPDLRVRWFGRSGYRGDVLLERALVDDSTSLSGLWYDPAWPSTRWVLSADADGRVAAVEFGLASGRARWLAGTGTLAADGSVAIPLISRRGGRFGAHHDPSLTRQVGAGELRLRELQCGELAAELRQGAATTDFVLWRQAGPRCPDP